MSWIDTRDQGAAPSAPSAGDLRWYSLSQTPYVITSGGLAIPLTGAGGVLTANGDLLTRIAGVDARLPIGAEGQRLAVASGLPAWVDSAADPLELALDEHWITNNVNNDTIGRYGWRTSTSGPGSAVSFATWATANRPGIVQLTAGTGATGRAAVHLDNSLPGFLFDVTGGQSPFEFTTMIMPRTSIAAADLELIQLGFLNPGESGTTGESTGEAVYVRIVGGAAPVAELVVRGPSGTSVSAGTTTIALNTWHRVGFRWTSTGGGSVQLVVDGVDEGPAVTTNFPTVELRCVHKIDSAGGANSPEVYVDRTLIQQAWP